MEGHRDILSGYNGPALAWETSTACIVKSLLRRNPSNDVVPDVATWRVGPSPNPIAFQQLKETLREGVVLTVTASDYTGFQVGAAEERLALSAGELEALVGMHRALFGWLSSPSGHQKGLQDLVWRLQFVGRLAIALGPATIGPDPSDHPIWRMFSCEQ